MDNRITKQRLQDFFSYEWVTMVIAIILAIVMCSFVFNIFEVKATVGQTFNIIFDQNIKVYNEDTFYEDVDSKAFSFEILDWQGERMNAEYNVLDIRIQTHDADVLFTDSVISKEEGDVSVSRAWSVIDGFEIVDYRTLADRATQYLKQFLQDAWSNKLEFVTDFSKLDLSKIDKHFESRAKQDNRFRTTEKMNEGKLLERERIKTLCSDLAKMNYLLTEHSEIFMNYTKYQQALDRATAAKNQEAIDQINGWIEEGSGNMPYAIDLGKLTSPQGKTGVSNFFKVGQNSDATDVVLMVIDLEIVQHELQFESLGFAIFMVENYTDLLIGFQDLG